MKWLDTRFAKTWGVVLYALVVSTCIFVVGRPADGQSVTLHLATFLVK